MKKSKILIPLTSLTALGTIVAPLASLTSCTPKEEPKIVQYTVHFETFNGTTLPDIQVDKDTKVAKPETMPYRQYWKFVCWCVDPACNVEYNFDTLVTKDLTLYAKYEIADLSKITFDVSKVKKEQFIGEGLDLTGLEVSAVLSDGSTISIPSRLVETSPKAGSIITEDTKEITVTYEEFSTKFEITPKTPSIVSVEFGLKPGFSTDVALLSSIHRSDFVVNAVYETGKKAQTFAWESEEFGSEDYIIFDELGTQSITLKFAGRQQTFGFNVYGAFVTSLPDEFTMTLPTNGSGVVYATYKQLTVYEAGEPVTEDRLEYRSSDATVAAVEGNGLIRTIKEGKTTIQARLKGSTKEEDWIDTTTINVVNIPLTSVEAVSTTGCIYKSFKQSNGVCVMPDQIMIDGTQRPVTELKRLDNTEAVAQEMKDVITLYLPTGLKTIEADLFSKLPQIQSKATPARLTNVIYQGDLAGYKGITNFDKNWGGDQLVCVDCDDQDYMFSDHNYNSDIIYTPVGEGAAVTLGTQLPVAKAGDRFKIKLDYSKFIGDGLAGLNNIIGMLPKAVGMGTRFEKVWLNGQLLTEGKNADYVFDFTYGTITILPDAQGNPRLNANSSLVIQIQTSVETASYFGCVPNIPVKMEAKLNKVFYKDDAFDSKEVTVTATRADEETYEVPHEFLHFSIPDGFVFDKVQTYECLITDKYTGLETTLRIHIREA